MRRIDGRLVIGAMVLVGLVFVVLNLFLAKGPSEVRTLSSPSSSAARLGRTYPIRLLSGCAPAVDFDGSYWAPPGGSTVSAPLQPATVRLISGDRAILRLASGQRVRLSRRGDTIRLGPCPSPRP